MSILTTRSGHIRILTIDRPEVRNALDDDHSAQMTEHIDRWAAEDDAWVVIITATGNRAFCAGADLKARQKAIQSGMGVRTSRGPGFGGSPLGISRNR